MRPHWMPLTILTWTPRLFVRQRLHLLVAVRQGITSRTHPNPHPHPHQRAAHVLAIALPSASAAAIAMLLCVWFIARRCGCRRAPIKPYMAPRDTLAEVPTGKAGGWSKTGLAREESHDRAAPGAESVIEDPVLLIAIQRAVRHAGFSTRELLESLQRVTLPGRNAGDGSSTAPPHYE